MKKEYMQPALSVVTLHSSHIICTSTINPGADNTQPGARSFDGWGDDDDWDNTQPGARRFDGWDDSDDWDE